MTTISNRPAALALLALCSLPMAGALSAQETTSAQGEPGTTVIGVPPADLSGMPAGPEVEGYISARRDGRLQVTSTEGTHTTVLISEGTEIKASKGLFGMGRNKLGSDALLNGLPVTVRTVEWGGNLVASRVDLKNKDLKTATMIRRGTEQGFADQTAATEALRGRLGDIDKYNIMNTTNVHFATGKSNLTEPAKADLCTAATEASQNENALILVVGYTDSTGDEDYNQVLSEKRASRVVNYLQQACGWKPYRMLTPTGMAEADPLGSNDTIEGKAQNRRVSVNVLVSKSLAGL